MTTATISVPPKILEVFDFKNAPRGAYRYRYLYGGRGSGKSHSAALIAAVWGYSEPIRVLCVREFQVSIRESFHMELRDAIERLPWLKQHYTVTDQAIRGKNGTEFIFKGMHRNESGIKSTAKIDLTIVEEAEDVSEAGWLALEATVFRQPKSELWAIWNPKEKNSPVDNRFRQNPPTNGIGAFVNYDDNCFLPDGLKDLVARERQRLPQALFDWVWNGDYLEESDVQVLNGCWKVSEFDPQPNWLGPYHGVDFGYNDPLAAVKCWMHDDTLYVEREAYGPKIDMDDYLSFIDNEQRIPGFSGHVIRGDSAEPKTISYMKRHGWPKVEGVQKWPGSVIEGARWLRSLKGIVVHTRCKETQREFRLWSFKQDPKTNDIYDEIVDANNHIPDAIRYACAPMIRSISKKKIAIPTMIGLDPGL